MNMFLAYRLAGLLAIAGQTFCCRRYHARSNSGIKGRDAACDVSERNVALHPFSLSPVRPRSAFSAKIFDRYLNLLDYSHNVLLASDVEQFGRKKTELGDELRFRQTRRFHDHNHKAPFERYQYALSVYWKSRWISPATTLINRSKAPSPKTRLS